MVTCPMTSRDRELKGQGRNHNVFGAYYLENGDTEIETRL